MYYIVYFLESIPQPNRHYIGFTGDVKQRLPQHNNGLVTSTKNIAPGD